MRQIRKDPMSNFRKTRRQSEGQPKASFHGERQHEQNNSLWYLQGQPGSYSACNDRPEPKVRPNVINVQLQASGSAGEGNVGLVASRENEAGASVRRGERTNNSKKLLRKRDTQRSNSSEAALVNRRTTNVNAIAEINGPTIGINTDVRPRHLRPTSNLPVTDSSSKSGPDRSNSIVTLSSLKHTSIPNNSTTLPIERTKKAPTARKNKSRTMSHANSYGKVSNPARPVGQGEDSSNPSGHPHGAQGGSSTESNTPQRHGSYTLITPNSIKRNKVLTQASKETADYESYKESRRVNYVKTTPQTLGGTKSEEEIRKQREKDAQDKKYEMIMKRKKWDEEKKAREEAEYREKKERAREQAIRNQQRKAERQDTWNEDHRRTNEAFLRRLEQQQK